LEIFENSIATLLNMTRVEKMRMAFDFYAHKYEDKITIHDALTIMSHLNQYDFLLQRDLKQIFKGLSKSGEHRSNTFRSPEPSFRQGESSYDDRIMSKQNSREREFFVIPKLIKKRKYRKSKIRKRPKFPKVVKSAAVSPNRESINMTAHSHIVRIGDQSSIHSPTRSNNSYLDQSKYHSIANINVKSIKKQKGFLEYADDMYAKLLRIQKNKGVEEMHTSMKTKAIDPFSANRTQRSDSLNNSSLKTEECRRGLNVINIGELTSKE
jgi:hypothetical protein